MIICLLKIQNKSNFVHLFACDGLMLGRSVAENHRGGAAIIMFTSRLPKGQRLSLAKSRNSHIVSQIVMLRVILQTDRQTGTDSIFLNMIKNI